MIATVAASPNNAYRARRGYKVVPVQFVRRNRDVSHLQLKDENGYHYPKPEAPFPPQPEVTVDNEYLPPPNEYLPP